MNATEPRTLPYCDLVMKGGITSGLVYPRAVVRIGKDYWFRNIGGTSAGAIAAAVSAAAALGERRIAAGQCTAGGLAMLEQTAAQLASPGFILSLFQPVRQARGAFRLLVQFTGEDEPSLLKLAAGAALLAPVALVLSFVFLEMVGFAIGGIRGALAAALPSAVVAFIVALACTAMDAARAIRSNFLGMCTGIRPTRKAPLALTEWLHREIRRAAGEGEADGPPVTLGDLWSAPLYPGEEPLGYGERPLNLEVITTDVSHSEPRTLPFTKGTLWFRRDEMERLFPQSIVEAMVGGHPAEPLRHENITYHAFPTAEKLPIVVAARMSLSFPLLISAVPLYEQHFLAKEDRRRAGAAAGDMRSFADAVEELSATAAADKPKSAEFEMRVCWFTDGGVSSNFPIHLFDAPMPRWPTFAIDLVYPPAGQEPAEDPIFLPVRNNQGWRPRYTPIGNRWAVKEIGSFVMAIVSTMQNWRDLLQGRAPGHRDRIVQVEIETNEGGMNLNMPEPVLSAVAGKGEAAGERLVTAFDFENHFWVRYRNLEAALERFGLRLHKAMATPPRGAEKSFRTAMEGEGRPPSYAYSAEQAREAARRINELLQEFEDWEDWDGTLTKGAPNPPPHLRIVPIF